MLWRLNVVKTINSLRIWAVWGQITVNLGLILITGISPQCSMSYRENHTESQVVSPPPSPPCTQVSSFAGGCPSLRALGGWGVMGAGL